MSDDTPDADAVFGRRARSFGASAAAYAEHRPDYPADGIGWALAAGGAQPGRGGTVLDLAAGTGKLTDGLLALGYGFDQLIAVEPDAGMRAELTRRLPDLAVHDGTAEHVPLPAGAVDAVLVGQAFHWFDQDRALTEIARVLRPGGSVGALWNHEDRAVDWVDGLAEMSATAVGGAWLGAHALPEHRLFGPFERAEFAHRHRRTADSLTATIGTHSHALVVSADERAALLDRVRRYLADLPETATGEFDVPLVTTVIRGARHANGELAGPGW